MPTIAFRPRSPSEIVDAAFQLLRRDYLKFVTLMAIAYIPWLIVLTALRRTFGYDPTGATPPDLTLLMLSLGGSMIWYSVVNAALIVAASDSYLGRDVDVGRALREVLPRFWPVLVSAMAKWLAVMFGTMLLIVPGFYFYAKYFAVPATVVIEKLGAMAGLRRAGELSKGEKGKILKTMLLAFAIIIVFSFVTGVLAAVFPSNPMLVEAASIVVTILIYPLVALTETLLYYDLRMRREGYDIELMAQELGRASEQPAF